MAFLKTIWKSNSKHRKLPEELTLQNNKDVEIEPNEILDTANDVVTFKLKYLGSTVVEKISTENINTEAVKNILKTAKAAKGRRKKLQRVDINISVKGIDVTDLQGNDILKISIYRISNCSTDPTHRQIFSFISTDATETMECHAFLCSKRKVAETVTLAVAQAFSTAYEAWRVLPTTKEFERNAINAKENEQNNINQGSAASAKRCPSPKANVEEERLIDFDDDDDSCEPETDPLIFEPTLNSGQITAQWVCFDDDFSNGALSKNAFDKVDLILA